MSRSLYIAFRSSSGHGSMWGPVGRLDVQEGGYSFYYTRGALELKGFKAFPGMSDFEKTYFYESEELPPLFMNRLLSPSRPEFDSYLSWSGFDPANPPSPIAILAVTEGRRQTDSFEVFPVPEPDEDGAYTAKFFLHGLRWMPEAASERVASLLPGDRLALLLDIQNEHDPHAVAVRPMEDQDRLMLGYVPRYLAWDIKYICRSNNPDFINVTVERVNKGAPIQQRLLCKIHTKWPAGFEPCGSSYFEPLVVIDKQRAG